MNVKRYLVLVIDGDTPEICELPCLTLEEAMEVLRTEFEGTIARAYNGKETPEYAKDGTASCVEDGMEYFLHNEFYDDGPSFYVWDGKDYECRGSIREISVALSDAELESAYRLKEQRYLLEDAERHLYELVGYEPEAEEGTEEAADNETANQQFIDAYGFSISEAVNRSSDFFQLDYMVDLFQDKRDCNVPENDVWEIVAKACLASLKKGEV